MEWLFRLTHRTRGIPWPARYAMAALFVAVAFAAQFLWGGDTEVFVFFFLAILLSGGLFDRGSAFLATALSALAADWYLIAPVGRLLPADPNDTLAIAVFVAAGAVASAIIEGLHIMAAEKRAKAIELEAALTRTRQLARENKLLVAEMDHRIRNHLQMSASLLNLHSRASTLSADEAFTLAADSISTIARLHRTLAGEQKLGALSLQKFLGALCADLQSSFAGPRSIAVTCAVPDIVIPRRAASTLGLLVSELVTNAFKHAFPGRQEGKIAVEVRPAPLEIELRVTDDGIGISDAGHIGGGRRLIDALLGQLGGRMEIDCRSGCRVSLFFPADSLLPTRIVEAMAEPELPEI